MLCAALALRFFGYGAMDLVVFALGICALAILLGCLFSVIVCGLILQRRIEREPAQAPERAGGKAFEAGFPNRTGFVLPPVGLLPLVRLQWTWRYPDHIDSRVRIAPDGLLEEEINPRLRCLGGHVTRRFEVSDVLGLCRYCWRARREQECYVLPRVNTLKHLPLLHALAAEDGIPRQSGEPVGDRMEIRPYAAGDSVRDILWKNYARTRQLNVRLRERSVARGRRVLAYLLAGPGDEAAAAAARAALESSAFGDDWQFSADGTETPCDDLESALRAVARSRALDQPHAPGLERFLAAADQRGAAHCIVFAGVGTIAGLAAAGAAGLPRGGLSLVLAVDGIEAPRRPPRWRSLLLRPSAGQSRPSWPERAQDATYLRRHEAEAETADEPERAGGARRRRRGEAGPAGGPTRARRVDASRAGADLRARSGGPEKARGAESLRRGKADTAGRRESAPNLRDAGADGRTKPKRGPERAGGAFRRRLPLLRRTRRRAGGSGGSREELLVLCRQLGPAVASIILVDRAAGICYDDKLRRI